MFDTARQRWIVSELSWDCATHTFPKDLAAFGHGYIDYAISNTADPLGSWTDSYFVFHDLVAGSARVRDIDGQAGIRRQDVRHGPGRQHHDPRLHQRHLRTGSDGIVTDWASLAGASIRVTLPYVSTAYPELDALRVATQEPIVDADVRMIGLANGPGRRNRR